MKFLGVLYLLSATMNPNLCYKQDNFSDEKPLITDSEYDWLNAYQIASDNNRIPLIDYALLLDPYSPFFDDDINKIANEISFSKVEFNFVTDSDDKVSGDIEQNGDIEYTDEVPTTVRQHIFDNSKGIEPITYTYPGFSKELKEEVSVTNTKEYDFTQKVELDFSYIDLSASFEEDFSNSKTITNSTTVTESFDNFSLTLKPGEKEKVNYIILNSEATYYANLILKLDAKNTYFYFTNNKNNEEYKVNLFNMFEQESWWNKNLQKIASDYFINGFIHKYDNSSIIENNQIKFIQAKNNNINQFQVNIPLIFNIPSITTKIETIPYMV